MTMATELPERRAARPWRCRPAATTGSARRMTGDGVTFCVYARRATGLDLLLFERLDDMAPDPGHPPRSERQPDGRLLARPRAAASRAGQLYGVRRRRSVGARRRAALRRDQAPARPVRPGGRHPGRLPPDRGRATGPTTATAMKSVVVDTGAYDWEGDRPLGHSWRETIVYEAHLARLHRRPELRACRAERRGTYAGFIDKIPYLVDLGITAVELLPVFAFDRLAAPAGLVNYWGYQPVSFFAPHAGLRERARSRRPRSTSSATWSRRSTGPASRSSSTSSTTTPRRSAPTARRSRSAAWPTTTTTSSTRPAAIVDDSGTGNTFNANRPIVRRLILDSLRYWVQEMHVDGFRFDLAAVLSRDEAGQPMADPPALWDIETDPVLAGTKLIAEAWDAGGLYQVGSFVGERWVEWNGRFRDDVRSFVKGDRDTVPAIMQRFLGSPDIYGHKRREPQASVNFVTCHDGFTLNDLVSYDAKHNEANGEGNRDGNDQNLSWNCGVEGPTDDPAIEALRARQVRNFLAFDLLALGRPDAAHGRRGAPDAGRQQQRLRPRRSD